MRHSLSIPAAAHFLNFPLQFSAYSGRLLFHEYIPCSCFTKMLCGDILEAKLRRKMEL